MSDVGNVGAFHPYEITMKRRPDGHYDLVALCDVPGFYCGDDGPQVGEVTMIVDDVFLMVHAQFDDRKVISYSMSIASPVVQDEQGMFMWQQLKEDPREAR